MADYDPFDRGPHTVGVRTADLVVGDDEARAGGAPSGGGPRVVPVEVWYPAAGVEPGADTDPATQDRYSAMEGLPPTPQEAVRDAAVADGRFAPIVFSHGFAGHRRQTTHLCTHLASHGYVVAAPDHVGNTTADVMGWMMGGTPPADMDGYMRACAADRPRDARATLDALLSGELGVPTLDDGAGMAGHSFGGWTTLTTTAQDDRIVAALPLAPAGGNMDGAFAQTGVFEELVELDWGRAVPTLMIVADEDSVLPLSSMHDLLDRGSSLDRMVVLVNADHFHFCDGVEVIHDLMAPMMGGQTKTAAEFVPGNHAHQVTNGLGLAHFDATIREVPEAAALLERSLEDVLAARGIAVTDLAGA